MIAAMAVAAGAAFAETAPITSANIVGYNTLNTGDKTVMLGSSFEAMDAGAKPGDGILLRDLQGDFADDDNLQVASVVGGRVKFTNYFYYTEDYGYEPEGWYDGSDNYVGDSMRLPLGSAVWFASGDGSAKAITSAGQVRSSEFTHSFKEKNEMVCSAYPTGFNPNAATWNGAQDDDNIQVAAVVGGRVKFTNYFYYTEDYGYEPEGWYDGNDNYVNAPIAAPGQGFWVVLGDPSNVTMTENTPIK